MKIFNPYGAKIPRIDSIKITKEAFKKMNLYASIVSETIGDDKECMGTLLDYENRNDNIARDVYLWKDQIVTSSSGFPEDVQNAYDEAKKKGMKIIGFWHSHGNLPVFHSPDDDEFLTNRYREINNKIVAGEKEKSIECIVDGETIKLFEEGSNKEIRIKGKIKDIKYVERDEYNILNSIVINKHSYSENSNNPKSKNFNAEIWIWYEKAIKKFKDADLKLVDETNNISLDKEEMVKEVGDKVRFQGSYLKELPNYQAILDKCKKINSAEEKNNSIERIVEESSKDIDKKKVWGTIIPSATWTTSGNGYHKRIYDFYTAKKYEDDKIISKIGLIGEILAGDYHKNGKRYWFWTDRLKKAEEVYKEIKGNICQEQYVMLRELLDILNINRYAKRKHGKKINKMCKKMGLKGKVKIKKSKNFFSRIFGGFKK